MFTDESNLFICDTSENLLFPDILPDYGLLVGDSSKTALIEKLQSRQPSHTIHSAHRKEWTDGSGVSELITRLNLESLDDLEEIARRLDWKKYTHTPGWWSSGINPRNGQRMGFMHGQFKPNEPIKLPKAAKPAKYLSSKAQYDAICLDTGNPKFWLDIIQNISIPVYITEGAKKAASGLTEGYPTLALLGVDMGLNDGDLVGNLAVFAKPGRLFYLCFDGDIVRKKSVQQALLRLSKVLAKRGCTVKVVTWDESRGKGMDDFLVNNGDEEFNVEIARAQLIQDWETALLEVEEDNKEKKNKLPQHSEIATLLKPRMGNLRFCDRIHQWMKYRIGHWSIASQESLFQVVTDSIEELYPGQGFASAYPGGVVKMMVSRLLFQDWTEPPRNLLPFINGVLNLDTKEMLPHSPDYGFTSIINREHDKDATDWSAISDWMDFIFYNNASQKHLFCCWYAALVRGMWGLHRFALIVGEGGTGKSTAMKLGSDLVGTRSSHSLTLEALNANSFQTGNIYDKRLVCVNDADRYHGGLGIFKNITGGDEINVEWKFEKAFNAVYKGLVMVSANNPVFTSNDSGLDRRVILFKLDRKVSEIDPLFADKLSDQIPGFTNYLLSIPVNEIIHTLLYKVDRSGVREQNELEALLQTNAVADWLNAKYKYDPDSQLPVGADRDQLDQLYGDYCDYCRKSGSSPRSSKEFSPEVIRLGRGMLVKTKTRSGATIQGLSRDDCGGIIETLISMKFRKAAVDPSHPSQNTDNPTTASNPDVVDNVTGREITRHTEMLEDKTVMGRDGSVTGQTVHPSQPGSTTPQPSQTFLNPSVTGVTGKPEKLRDQEKNKLIKSSGHSLQDKIIALWSNHAELGEIVVKASRKELDRTLASWSDDQKAHVRRCERNAEQADWNIVAIRNMFDQFNHDSVTKLIKDWEPGLREAVWHRMTPNEREVECFKQINPNSDLEDAQKHLPFKLE